MNVLTAVNRILETPGQVERLHSYMMSNPLAYKFMHQWGVFPSHHDVRKYFQWLKQGFEYALKYWGEIALPKQLTLLVNPPRDSDGWPFYIGYTFNGKNPRGGDDKLGISFAKIAHDCVAHLKEERVNDKHLPGIWIAAADWATLQGIEECHHCKEIRSGYLIDTNIHAPAEVSHPIERKINAVFGTAINRLRINCYRKTKQSQPTEFDQTLAKARDLLKKRGKK